MYALHKVKGIGYSSEVLVRLTGNSLANCVKAGSRILYCNRDGFCWARVFYWVPVRHRRGTAIVDMVFFFMMSDMVFTGVMYIV